MRTWWRPLKDEHDDNGGRGGGDENLKPVKAATPGSRETIYPTVGVALCGTKVTDQLSSLREELPVRMKMYSYIRFRTRAYK